MAFSSLNSEQDLLQEAAATPAASASTSPAVDPSNKTFIIAAGGLGALALISLLAIAAYALLIAPQRRGQQAQQVAALSAQNTQVAAIIAATQTAVAWQAQVTPTSLPTNTPLPSTPTPTAVVVVPTTAPPTIDPRTPTVAALLTQQAAAAAASAQITPTVVGAVKALPQTGFAEDVGLPSLMGLAVVLLGIIFMARRLRMA